MPELPEVETIVKRLNKVLSGKTIVDVSVLKQKSFQGDSSKVVNLPITGVSRRAKLIRFHLPNNLNLLAHLKMTGQFILVDSVGSRLGGGHPTADWVQELPSKHTRVVFALNDPNKATHRLFFNDMRIFGWIKVLSDSQIHTEYAKYGPDVHTPQASIKYFSQKLAQTGRKIKQVIMDNSIISGVGNIYACDALNIAKINPLRPANSLSATEVNALLKAMKHVINLGIKLGGATISNYVDADGFAGKYQDQVRVYGRENEKCKNCGGTVKKIKLGGRGTYFCPICQV